MLPLLAAVLPAVAPWLMRQFAGEGAGRAAEAAAEAIAAVAGTDDPAEALARLQADGEACSALQVRLAEIAAQREAQQLADLANARSQTVALAQMGSPLAFGAAIISVAVMALFAFAVIGTAFGLVLPDLTMRLIEYAVIATLGYWLGSSAGSARKDARGPLGSSR